VGDEGRIQESMQLFLNSGIGMQREMHVHKANVGIAINQLEAYDYLAEHYENIVVLEDDVVLSPHWARLLPILFEEMKQRPDVFGFTTGFKRACEIGEIEANLDEVQVSNRHWWMIGFTRQTWGRIREHYMRYYVLVRGVDYGALPYKEIRKFFRLVGYASKASSQDAGKDMAVMLAGMKRVALVVNRGISIGKEGLHFVPDLYSAMKLDQQVPYIFASDATREAFKWQL
jgi:hypothetical protein